LQNVCVDFDLLVITLTRYATANGYKYKVEALQRPICTFINHLHGRLRRYTIDAPTKDLSLGARRDGKRCHAGRVPAACDRSLLPWPSTGQLITFRVLLFGVIATHISKVLTSILSILSIISILCHYIYCHIYTLAFLIYSVSNIRKPQIYFY